MLALGLILAACYASGQTNRTATSTLATREDAIKASSQLRVGMRHVDAQKVLKIHGLVSTGLGGSGHSYTVDYPLADGAMFRASFRYSDPDGFPGTNDLAWANDVLIDAGIWDRGNLTARTVNMLIGPGIRSKGTNSATAKSAAELVGTKDGGATGPTTRSSSASAGTRR